jgi:CBS domain-containing protein
MTRIAEVLNNRRIFSVEGEQTVLEAARYMTEFNIGAVPVLRGGELAGIFSERDIMRRVVAGGRSPAFTKVAEVMTPRPFTLSPDDTLEKARFVMLEHGFRHLPVVDGARLAGIISLREVLPSNTQLQAKAS